MNKNWIPADQTDIRRTWAQHWPKETRDEVLARIIRQIDSGDTLPPPALVVVHKSPERMQ